VTASVKSGLDVRKLLGLFTLCIFASLVKYAFLPIFLVIVGYVIINLFRSSGNLSKLSRAFSTGWRQTGKLWRWGLIILLLLASSLFVERYGINVIRYHTPVADCGQVLDFEHCQSYGPWIRDYNLEQTKVNPETNPLAYTQHWFYGMWFRTFFAVDGPSTGFQTRGPLLSPSVGAIIWASLGGLALLLTTKRLWWRYDGVVLWLFVSVSVVYVAVLWLQEYQLFTQTGKPVAINGRYLLPILPMVILLLILAINELIKNVTAKYLLGCLVLLSLVWGGGVLTYILRSNDAWYWSNTPLKGANHSLQSALGPITPGYHKPTQFLH
jgi:hypothetical protein